MQDDILDVEPWPVVKSDKTYLRTLVSRHHFEHWSLVRTTNNLSKMYTIVYDVWINCFSIHHALCIYEFFFSTNSIRYNTTGKFNILSVEDQMQYALDRKYNLNSYWNTSET